MAEAECKKLGIVSSCDLQIFVDDRPGLDGNAFQTRDRFGRPAILFTLPLLVDARNEDELAFILAHEAAHQIEGHIGATERSAEQGAMIFGSLAQAQGQSRADIAAAAALGAQVGARRFSKVLELRADRLGTVIAARAGYDPVLGSAYFARIPDPGDEFLGTHPPNAERKALVREVSATLARQP
ncbi:M48 family metallopeptidase [Aliiruegeria haliotis]|uniref:M48 family metallopeptidase n=1 Tax=Aliiruegeria haliotis TaxID=1280846 RepID=UPI001FE3994E|nr:M48 family metallopeptidase [Aliiruegeria haliotis]